MKGDARGHHFFSTAKMPLIKAFRVHLEEKGRRKFFSSRFFSIRSNDVKNEPLKMRTFVSRQVVGEMQCFASVKGNGHYSGILVSYFFGKHHLKKNASLSYFQICGISKLAMTQESFDHLEQKGHNRQNDYRFANVQSKRVVGHGTETYHILIGTCALLLKRSCIEVF